MKLTNDFHNSSTELRVKDGDTVSALRMRRVHHDLCGSPTCTCSDATGRRGPQPDNGGLDLEPIEWDGEYKVIKLA
jgi:hypothetical protein